MEVSKPIDNILNLTVNKETLVIENVSYDSCSKAP